jgi:ribonuclease HI
MTARTEIYADGMFNDQTKEGGWAAVVGRTSTGRQSRTSYYEVKLRALVEAVKPAEGPCTLISVHEGIIGVAQQGRTPRHCQPIWQELYSAAAGKDVVFEWRRRDQSLGSRLAHQLARDAAKGR